MRPGEPIRDAAAQGPNGPVSQTSSRAEAAERLIREHKDAVYRQLYRMCGNREDAEDVLVESLVKAYRALESLDDEESFRAWLVQIARRTCGRLKKHERLHPVLALASLEASGWEASAEESLEEKVLEGQLKECILRAFDTLPELYAAVYRARDLDGLSAEETSENLGITVAAVKSRLHRARQMIRERVECSIDEP